MVNCFFYEVGFQIDALSPTSGYLILKTHLSDQGSEFDLRNKHIYEVLVKKHRVKAYTLSGKTKATIAERAIRTLKTRLARYFTESGTTKWISVLDQFVNNYNNTIHTSIGMPPNDVSLDNASEVRKRLYGDASVKADCKLNLQDIVRIPLEKNIFSKGLESEIRNSHRL